jgi:hypothetical protein
MTLPQPFLELPVRLLEKGIDTASGHIASVLTE